MTSQQWSRIRDVFERGIDLDADARNALLAAEFAHDRAAAETVISLWKDVRAGRVFAGAALVTACASIQNDPVNQKLTANAHEAEAELAHAQRRVRGRGQVLDDHDVRRIGGERSLDVEHPSEERRLDRPRPAGQQPHGNSAVGVCTSPLRRHVGRRRTIERRIYFYGIKNLTVIF